MGRRRRELERGAHRLPALRQRLGGQRASSGSPPKTAWVIGYPLLERIHYLLVAGFDVFGNVSHQVTTRLYMDFFAWRGRPTSSCSCPRQRKELTDSWYRGVTGGAKDTVAHELQGFTGTPRIAYRTGDPKAELFALIAARVGRVEPHGYDLERIAEGPLRLLVDRLSRVRGRAASLLPELSFVTVTEPDAARSHLTVLRDSAHTNVAHLFQEDARRVPTRMSSASSPASSAPIPTRSSR